MVLGDAGEDAQTAEITVTKSTNKGESSKGQKRITDPGKKWNSCPLSPDMSAGFSHGARLLVVESDDEGWETSNESKEKNEGIATQNSPKPKTMKTYQRRGLTRYFNR